MRESWRVLTAKPATIESCNNERRPYSGGSLIEGPGEKRAHCIPMWRAPGHAHPQPRPLFLANQECPHLRRPGLPPLLLGVAPFAGFALVVRAVHGAGLRGEFG